ncbi:MAG: hypothetical protein MJ246_04060 [Clostridia bacterium]|nr:hypothetical protein [Clostridia bacterium]
MSNIQQATSRCELCPYVHYDKISAWDEDGLKMIAAWKISCKTLRRTVTKTLDTKQPFKPHFACPFKNMTDEEFKKYVDEFFSDDSADFM